MELGRWLKHACAVFIVVLLHINASLSLGHHHANVAERCIERERDALLAIKGDLVDEHNLLSSWEGEDCCGWERVYCDQQTGHVIQLHLGGGVPEVISFRADDEPRIMRKRPEGEYIPPKILQGEISPKIIELQYLEYLDLSYNSFNASQIPAVICSLSNLRHLDLRFNSLSGSKIPQLIGNLTNLRYLDLYQTGFSGEIPTQMCSLSNLRHLDLSYNDLNVSNIPLLIGNLTVLRYLDLSVAFTDDEIPILVPYQLGNLTHLQYLNLHDTPFTFKHGNLNWLPHLSSLKYLDMSRTNLSKASDWLETISKLPNLRNLTLIGCDLPPPILSTLSHINSSSSLGHVSLFNNVVNALIFKWLYNHNTTLAYLDLSNTQLSRFSGSIPDVFRNMRSLKKLYLSSNQFNGSISDVFKNMSSLEDLDLSYNQLSGLSLNAFINMRSLEYLDLYSNQLGSLNPNAFTNMSSLSSLDLSSSQLSGLSPTFVNMRSLASLDLSFNILNGLSPNAFINTSSLTYLELSDNPLEGEIPTSIAQLCSLQILSIKGCNLIGQLSESVQRWSTCPQNSFQYLDLSYNHLVGPFPVFTNFSSLEKLYLSGNKLSGMVPNGIGKLSSLKLLDVEENQLRGMIPESIGELSSLQYLHLSGNLLSERIPESIGQVLSLLGLDLSRNQLSGRIPESIGKLLSLEKLDLSRNQLSGRIPESIGKLSSLKNLNLQENLLRGRIPEGIGELSSLQSLDLSINKFRGRLPQRMSQLSNLGYLNLSMNNLEGEISDTHFLKFSVLRSLDLSYNSLLEFNLTNPSFQLSDLSLRSCQVGPNFPKWLRNQNSLYNLDLSHANISDVIPSWLWGVFSDTPTIDFSNNQIRGALGSLKGLSASEFEFRLSSNQLHGPVPSFLSNASYLDLSDNHFSEMTSFLCSSNVKVSKFLDFSKNNITGEVPDCWRQWANLEFLDLSFNGFYGKIPTSIGSLHGIKTLKLRSNKLVGELPSSLKNCTSLNVIDFGGNHLSSFVPEWIGGSLPNLVILMLQSNQLGGSLPSQLCHLAHLQILDISMNEISGSIPKCLNSLTSLAQEGNSNRTIRHSFNIPEPGGALMSSLYYEDDATFMWKGALASFNSILGLVKRIDLSSNKLTGEIPSEITDLVGLVSLNLSRNSLSGKIPLDIGKLKSLDSLDLSRNKIGGGIPTSVAHIDRLGDMDLSYNNLSGVIPTGTQLQSFNASSYAGNPLLCGPPLHVCNPEGTGRPNVSSGENDPDELITQGFYICLGLGFAVGFWGVCGSLIFKRSWRYAYYNFLNVSNDWLYVKVALIRRKLRILLNRQQP